MDFRKWQEDQKKQQPADNENLPLENFFGRKDELAQLQNFIDEKSKKVFFVYGVPMIGKSTLAREFCKSALDYRQVTIKFSNPENPETTIERTLAELNIKHGEKLFIVIENFEEALQWKGESEHLHEIRFQKVRRFVQDMSELPTAKLLIESRFQIKNDFLSVNQIAELKGKQLGKIDRRELFSALNDIYRHGNVPFDSFEQLCEGLNDHVWLIELAMQNDWLYEDVLEAVQHPKSLTQKLWEKVEAIIRKLSTSQRTLLCAFAIINPISEVDLLKNLGTLKAFEKNDALNNSLLSLRKKLLLVYEAKQKHYEINPFLREVCFTYLQGQKELQVVQQLPFFGKAKLPKYNNVIQAQEKGDYGAFYRLIHDLRKKKSYNTVHEILHHVLETDSVINKIGVLNEIGITYKWQRNYPKAIETLEGALKIEPENVKLRNELAIVYKEQKDYPKAIKNLEKALEINDQDVKTLNELAIVFKEQKNYPKALEIFTLLTEEHAHIPAYNEMGMIYKEQRNYDKAIECLEKACIMGNMHSFSVLAFLYKEQNNYHKAIETLEKALTVYDRDVKTLRELAVLYKETGDYEKAREIANKGLTVERNNPFFRSVLAKISKEGDTMMKTESKQVLGKQKILFLAANPSNESKLQTDREYRIIKAEIKRGTHRDAFEFLQPQIAVTVTELLRALNEKPQIIHFSGHGDTAGIVITNDNNQSLLLPLPAMERLFKPLKEIARIVVLNSCYSAIQAKTISEYGMYVIGNNSPIGDKAAIDFAKGLYNGLSEGKQFESAFNDAMAVVLAESPKYSNVIEVWRHGVKLTL